MANCVKAECSGCVCGAAGVREVLGGGERGGSESEGPEQGMDAPAQMRTHGAPHARPLPGHL